ncbi:WhiB family transcriptional regulator [Streptomyces sp. NPDC058961]|uniref:WhiB family transcriptional regulator n=1 Tax=Streptomyces sp. NPDC058961 TaxID=3346680 RepID=UPI003698FA93
MTAAPVPPTDQSRGEVTSSTRAGHVSQLTSPAYRVDEFRAGDQCGPPGMEWRPRAACRDVDPTLFFPDRDPAAMQQARAVCRSCSVVELCLAYGLRTKQAYGVWGGLLARSSKWQQAAKERS